MQSQMPMQSACALRRPREDSGQHAVFRPQRAGTENVAGVLSLIAALETRERAMADGVTQQVATRRFSK
jgi:cysteine sulfinate desulfinase/cysteine desulfurase-like protein